MYEKAVIYKLCCLDPEIKDCYVGSTCNLYLRKSQHKQACNNENSKNYNLKVYQFIRDNGNWENWTIVVLEQYPCNSKIEMHARERYHFEALGATLNSNYPSITQKEKQKEKQKEYQKEYHQANAEHLKEKQKEYYQANAEHIKEKRKEYHQANAEHLKEKQKEYYQANAEKIRERKSKKVKCECGAVVSYSHLAEHRKSNKHLNKMTTTE